MSKPRPLQMVSFSWAVVASVGPMLSLFGPAEGSPLSFTNVWGQTTTLYGQGLYALESTFKAPINQGTDLVVLFGLIPLLLWNSFRLSYRSTGPVLWLQAGLLSCALYQSTLQAFEVVFNELFLLYVVALSLSFFGFLLALGESRIPELQQRLQLPYPRRATIIFLLFVGSSVAVWLLEVTAALREGQLPATAGAAVTMPTYALDLAIIGPAVFLAAWLLYHRSPFGLLLTIILLTLNAFIGWVVIGQTIYQVRADIFLSPEQFVPFVAVFVVLSIIALGLLTRLLRRPPSHSRSA